MNHFVSFNSIECFECFETGFIFIKDPDVKTPVLMRCSCKYGTQNTFGIIPQWSRELLGVFEKVKFPVDHFRPAPPTEVASLTTSESFWVKAEAWSEKKKFSNDYWKQEIENAKKAREGA
jgi:hypothetical protein